MLEQRLFLVEVRLYGLSDLYAAQRGLGHITSRIPDGEFNPIGEGQGVGVGVDIGHDKAIPILIEPVRQIEQVVAF